MKHGFGVLEVFQTGKTLQRLTKNPVLNSKRNKVVFETLAISSDFDRLLPQETAISRLPVEVKLLGNCSPCKIEIFIYHSMITF